MDVSLWWLWMIIAAFFVVVEIFTAGFFVLWFGIGAAVAGILALLGLGAAWQWGAFVIISGVLFAASRRFSERITKAQPPGIGADRFIGQQGVVLEEINNTQNSGRVRLGKEEWRAESLDNSNIAKDVPVIVRKVDGTHLIVEEIKQEA